MNTHYTTYWLRTSDTKETGLELLIEYRAAQIKDEDPEFEVMRVSASIFPKENCPIDMTLHVPDDLMTLILIRLRNTHVFEEPAVEVPTSCGGAWMKFVNDQELMTKGVSGNFYDNMQTAFDAGWTAALDAVNQQSRPALVMEKMT